jgi:hypothetical protein
VFTSIRGVYGVVGVMLFLIALYLVLEHGGQASGIISAFSKLGVDLGRTLQGR